MTRPFDISIHSDTIPTIALSDAMDRCTSALQEAYHRRVARELVAAWRADYPALDVAVDTSVAIPPDADASDLVTIKAAFVPSYATDRRPQGYPADVKVERYVIDDMTRDQARRLYVWGKTGDDPATDPTD